MKDNLKADKNKFVKKTSRRGFFKVAAGGAVAATMTGCGEGFDIA